MPPVVIVRSPECTWVGFDLGEIEHNGKAYRLISPYLDKRPRHYVDLETPIEKIMEAKE